MSVAATGKKPRPLSNHSTSLGLWLADRIALMRPLDADELEVVERLVKSESLVLGRTALIQWTPDDVARLRDMERAGWKAPAIAKALNRTASAVRSYRKRLKRQG